MYILYRKIDVLSSCFADIIAKLYKNGEIYELKSKIVVLGR